jgi:acyl-CoA thioesterase FadM
MDYEIRVDTQVLATGHATLVFVDRSMRPVPIPDDVREAIRVFEDMPG